MTFDGRNFPRPQEYDEQVRRTIPFYDEIHDQTIDLVQALRPAPRVWLDTGCGTGVMVQRALDRMPGTTFLLSDPSPGMLDLARERLSGEGRARFIGPYPTQEIQGRMDERPDVITAVMCHHYLSRQDRARAVRACHDLLIEGGAFITFENVRPLTSTGTEVGMRRWATYQASQGRNTEEVKTHLARFDREYFPITVEEHLQLLRGTGFRAVELLWCSHLQAGFYCIK